MAIMVDEFLVTHSSGSHTLIVPPECPLGRDSYSWVCFSIRHLLFGRVHLMLVLLSHPRSAVQGRSWSERSGLRDMAVDLLQKTLYLLSMCPAVLEARICVRWKDPLHEKDQDPSHRGQPDIARWHQGRHRCADRSQNCRNIRRKSRYSAAGAELEAQVILMTWVAERNGLRVVTTLTKELPANESDRDGSDPLPTGHRGVRAGRRGGLCPQRRDNRGGPQTIRS